MLLNIHLLLSCSILYYEFNFSNAKALIGENVRQTRENEFPFVVALASYDSRDINLIRFCAGALISNRDVLTAEHCVTDKEFEDIKVIVGSNDLRRGSRFDIDWWVSYNQWVIYEDMKLEFQKNDVAILRLSVNVTNAIKPGVISSMKNRNLYGKDVTVAGWGNNMAGQIPPIMETVQLQVLTISECQNKGRKVDGSELQIHERLLCTAATPYALLNFGDSGDPILYNNEIVAVSFGTYLLREENFYSEKVNLHFGVDYYRNFIFNIKNYF